MSPENKKYGHYMSPEYQNYGHYMWREYQSDFIQIFGEKIQETSIAEILEA